MWHYLVRPAGRQNDLHRQQKTGDSLSAPNSHKHTHAENDIPVAMLKQIHAQVTFSNDHRLRGIRGKPTSKCHVYIRL